MNRIFGWLRSLARRSPPATRPALARWQALLESGSVVMGRHSYGAPRVRSYPGDARVLIGAFVSIAADVEVMPGGNHRADWISTFPFRSIFGLPGALEDGHPATKGDIVVGNDVWIGVGARILSGVTIGDGAVIGAGAVVTGDVRPYGIAVGNPAREVGRRFSDEQVAELLRIRWWDWPIEVVLEHVPLLSSPDIEAFIATADGSAE